MGMQATNMAEQVGREHAIGAIARAFGQFQNKHPTPDQTANLAAAITAVQRLSFRLAYKLAHAAAEGRPSVLKERPESLASIKKAFLQFASGRSQDANPVGLSIQRCFADPKSSRQNRLNGPTRSRAPLFSPPFRTSE